MAADKTQAAKPGVQPGATAGKVNYVLDASKWDQQDGDVYGGQSDVLKLEVGQVAGVFTYVGSQSITTELGDTTAHTATIDGEPVRLPIQATFLRALDQAGIQRGDQFIIKRDADVIKKQGKGKGQPMAIYAIKVTERVERDEVPMGK